MAILEAAGGQLDLGVTGVDPLSASQTVAIAHDYITQRGGAERVVLALARAFPGAPILTSLYDAAGTYPEFADLPISSAGIDRYEAFRSNHRLALPLLARSFSAMSAHADVVVASSSGWAHGVQTEGRKVVYCHNPARWLYQSEGYEPGRRGVARVGMQVLQRRLLRWDAQAARSADRYLANSTVVRDRIQAAYGIEADILHPPPALDPRDPQRPLPDVDAGFLLCVSRLMSYKNVDAVVEAMRGVDARLVVVGTGPDAAALRASAPANVHFAGTVDDDQLRWLYANCAALVSASYEDFGLSPLEAALYGKPSALLRYGGFLDTLDEGTTGLHFDEPHPAPIATALQRVLDTAWHENAIRAHVDQFSEERFIARFQEIVAEEANVGGVGQFGPVAQLSVVPASHRGRTGAPVVQAWRGLAAKATVMATDALSVTLAMLIAFATWRAWRNMGETGFEETHIALGAASVPIWLAAFAHAGLYRARSVASHMDEMRRIVRGVAVGVLGTAAAGGLLRLPAARLWFVLAAVFGVLCMASTRFIVRRGFERRRRQGKHLRPVVLVGGNSEAADIADVLCADPRLGYDVKGIVSDTYPNSDLPLLGSIADTLSAVRRTGATGVIIATTAVDHDTSNRLLRQLSDIGVHVELSSALQDIADRRLTIRPVGRLPLMHVQPTQSGGWRSTAKRAFDVSAASLGLLLAAPVLAIAALAIKLDSSGPVLFRQRRLGLHGRSFEIVKLRTMVDNAEDLLDDLRGRNEGAGPLFKLKDDPRVTRVGHLLRRSSVDEITQLWNVLRGEMSIVGPRPSLASESKAWNDDLHARLRVRPGITGMWQVNGRSDSTFEEYERLDIYYVENWSLATDLAIVARTIPAMLRTRGAY